MVELSAIHGEGTKHKDSISYLKGVTLKIFRMLRKQLFGQHRDNEISFIHLQNLISKNPYAPRGHLFLTTYFCHLHKGLHIFSCEYLI